MQIYNDDIICSRVNDLFDVKIFDAHTQNRVLIIILYYETLKI